MTGRVARPMKPNNQYIRLLHSRHKPGLLGFSTNCAPVTMHATTIPVYASTMTICDTEREKYARRQQSPTWDFHQRRFGIGSVKRAADCHIASMPRTARAKKLFEGRDVACWTLPAFRCSVGVRVSVMAKPAYRRPFLHDRKSQGTERRRVKARILVQMMVNFVCHCGSTV